MKLAQKQLQEFVSSPTRHYLGALIYGVDAGAVSEHCFQIKKNLEKTKPGFMCLEITEEEFKATPSIIVDECSALNLLGDKRLIYIRGATDKYTKSIEQALPFLNADCYLMVSAGELGPRSSLRLLFENNKQLAAVACYKDEGVDLHSLIRSTLAYYKLNADQDAITYIADHSGADRGVTLKQLEKLALYKMGNTQVSLEDAQLLIDDTSETSFDAAAIALADRNAAALAQALQSYFREGEPAVALLRVAQKYFQRLYVLSSAIEEGKSVDQAVADFKPPIFFRQQPIVKRQLRAWQRAAIAEILDALAKAELACKSSAADPQLLCANALHSMLRKQLQLV